MSGVRVDKLEITHAERHGVPKNAIHGTPSSKLCLQTDHVL